MILSLIFLLTYRVLPAICEVKQIALEKLITESDLIVVGSISKTWIEGNKKFAEVSVIKTLKGNPLIKQLKFTASPIFICDMNDANEGEVAVLFLYSIVQKNLTNNVQEVPKYILSHFGRGRFFIHEIENINYIQIDRNNNSAIKFPKKLIYLGKVKSKYNNILYIKLSEFTEYIEHQVSLNPTFLSPDAQ